MRKFLVLFAALMIASLGFLKVAQAVSIDCCSAHQGSSHCSAELGVIVCKDGTVDSSCLCTETTPPTNQSYIINGVEVTKEIGLYHTTDTTSPSGQKLHMVTNDLFIKLREPEDQSMTLELDHPIDVAEYQLEIEFKGLREQNGETVAILDINFKSRKEYDGVLVPTSDTGWIPNPLNYDLRDQSLLKFAKTLYRTHRHCNGDLREDVHKKGLAIVDLSKGYKNYVCRDRFYEQCFVDKSFDTYYEEFCDYGEVPFLPKKYFQGPDFGITLNEASEDTVKITITYSGKGVYKPPALTDL